MLLALTRRDACREALPEVVSALPRWLWVERRVVFATSFAEAHRAPLGCTVCLVDLGSVIGSADELIGSTRRLLTTRPWLSIVLLAAHVNPNLEADVIYGLRDLPFLQLIKPDELSDPARWIRMFDDHFVERHALMIEADLRAATPASQAPRLEEPEVRELLRSVARIRRVRDLAAASGQERVSVWRRFKRRWGHSPSEVLSLFRVLWATHLHAQGYAKSEIARLLGFRDAHHCARSLGARLGLRKSVLNRLAYRDILGGVVTCLFQGAPVKALVRRATTTLAHAARMTALTVTTMANAVVA